jgi:hypothetical protein
VGAIGGERTLIELGNWSASWSVVVRWLMTVSS